MIAITEFMLHHAFLQNAEQIFWHLQHSNKVNCLRRPYSWVLRPLNTTNGFLNVTSGRPFLPYGTTFYGCTYVHPH